MKKILVGSPEWITMTDTVERNHEISPSYLMMNLETGCPLGCPKCAQAELPYQPQLPLTLTERTQVLDAAVALGIRALVIVGEGEPTVPHNFRKLVRPVIELAHERNLVTILFTTGLGLHLEEQIAFYRDSGVTVFISLDSLQADTYRHLTHNGNLSQVLKNVAALRAAYVETRQILDDERTLVRLGVNVTIQAANLRELDEIQQFVGDDFQFIANEPMPQGRYGDPEVWEKHVGSEYGRTKQLAATYSETGGHSSVADDACSYSFRGLSVGSDGQLMSCGYAAMTAAVLPNVRSLMGKPDQLREIYQRIRRGYWSWRASLTGTAATDDLGCPLRNRAYQKFVMQLRE